MATICLYKVFCAVIKVSYKFVSGKLIWEGKMEGYITDGKCQLNEDLFV